MPVTLAGQRSARRKIANGTSGLGVRGSVMTKATSNAAPRDGGGVEAIDEGVDEGDEAAGDGGRAERVERAARGVTWDSIRSAGAIAAAASPSAC